MCKVFIALGVIVTFLGLGSTASDAYYRGRWCASVAEGNGTVRQICHFNDFAACQAEVISGNRGWCGPNPYWSGPAPSPARKRR
jgi:hypothetical protein